MRIIEKVALSLLLPALMMVNVYGEETSATPKADPATQETTTTTQETTTTTKETTKAAPATTENCSIPPACPPDRQECCSETAPQEEPSTK